MSNNELRQEIKGRLARICIVAMVVCAIWWAVDKFWNAVFPK
jgi:hypothetical protein